MKEQYSNKSMSQRYYELIATSTILQIAQAIAEAHTYVQILQLIHFIKANASNKWDQIRDQLKKVLVIQPQRIYSSDRFLSKHKLLLIRDIFKQEISIELDFFQNQSSFVLIAITEGFLLQDLGVQKMNKLKLYFLKNLKKQSNFWGLSQLQCLQNYLVDSKTGYYPQFNQTQHDLQLDRFNILLDFLLNNNNFFPQSIDINSILFKIMLCLRDEKERDKQLLLKIKKIYFDNKYHYQTTMKNMKFALQFFRNPFNSKDCLYNPPRAIHSILQRYNVEQIEGYLNGTFIGLKWDCQTVHNYFVGCIKLGITESASRLIIGMIKFCQKKRKLAELVYAFQNNLQKLFIFLKHKALFPATVKLVKIFMFSPPPLMSLYEKFVDKALPLIKTISQDVLYPYLNLLQVVAFHYKETTIVSELTSTIDALVGQNHNRLTQQEIIQELNQYNWKIQIKQLNQSSLIQRQSNFKGLVNIGNSCYINSFLQALFMNRQFTREIITVSTLELQRLKFKEPQFEGKDQAASSKLIRQDLRPLAELQRLFALLIQSKRNQISPLAIRNVSPVDFRNGYQHDSIQFGRLFLEMLYKNKINRIFEGEVTTSILCDGCKCVRERRQIFLDLMVTLQKSEEELSEIIQKQFRTQAMDDLMCDNCNQRQKNSLKKHFISKFPNYLIISVKRFQYNVTQKRNQKIMAKIKIKQTILIENQQYELYSIIIHRGPSPNAGHYFTFSKHTYDANSKWICHNDSEVTELENFKDVAQFMENNESDTPYILFLSKKEHINTIKEELLKPFVLKKALVEYVERDFLEDQKSKQKKAFNLINPMNLLSFFKKDDDDEENGGFNNKINFSNYIL